MKFSSKVQNFLNFIFFGPLIFRLTPPTLPPLVAAGPLRINRRQSLRGLGQALKNYVKIFPLGQKSGHLYVIFKSPIFWPNPLKRTSILGQFLRARKIYPKIEVLLRELGQQIGLVKLCTNVHFLTKKSGHLHIIFEGPIFDLIPLIVPRSQDNFSVSAPIPVICF